MQYTTGTVSVTNASAVVTGTGTSWSADVSAGDLFKLQGSPVIYQVASVGSDTQITLAANYAGSTSSGESYLICSDFTTNYDLPIISRGDVDWPDLLRKALLIIDTELAAQDARITALESA